MPEIIDTPDGTELFMDSRGRLVRAKGVTSSLPVKTIALTAYELRASDAGCRLLFTNTCTVTVPAASKVVFVEGTSIQIVQMAAGQVTLSAAVGVTINTPETLKTNKQYASAVLTADTTNIFTLAGYLEAA